MNSSRSSIVPTLIFSAVLMAIGGVIGFLARPLIVPTSQVATNTDSHSGHGAHDGHHGHGGQPAADGHAGHGSSSIVELGETTVANMNLLTGKFQQRDYVHHIRVPAQVEEYQPQGRQAVAAPLAGRVSQVFVTNGEAIEPGKKLFELTITDTSMSEAQLNLMSVTSKIESQQKRLDRLRPLADKGAIAGKQVINLELEMEQLERRKKSLIEEIRIRGVDEQGMQAVLEGKTFNRTVDVYAPKIGGQLTTVDSVDSVGEQENRGNENWLTVDSIDAKKGTSFQRGDQMCVLTWHGKLLLKGMAFESDMQVIAAAGKQGLPFAAGFGEAANHLRREGLPLFSIDNHVDRDSQTFPVYVSIDNEVASRHRDSDGRWHVNWRFKPGQRAHLEIPVENWIQQVIAPISAVVTDGPETFVFKKMDHTHQTDDGKVIVEFEKIPVRVLYQDARFAVLEDQLKLDLYENYALNKAHQLNMALKQAASGGGGGHAHHGHSH
jgi:multidrug efflux pump subunit AcrA (membrane-fusion protein)